MHVHFPSSRYFVAFVCVFCVMLCVSVPCDKSLCGWSGLPCGWGYSYCGRGKSPRSCSGLPCGKGHAELCSTSDLQVHSDWVIGRLPFCLQNSSGPLFDEWGNALSGRNNGSQSRLCTICGMFVYNPFFCMEISALHVPVDVYIFRYRPAHEPFVDKRNSVSYGKGTSRCHCTAVYRKHCVSYMKQTVVWGSVARDSSLIHEITQLQYVYCMKHTVVSWPFSLGHAYIQQRRLWFLCTLQFLLHRQHHCKHRLAFACTLTLLLLLGGDVETNPGPSKQWLKNQADKKRYLLHREKILAKKRLQYADTPEHKKEASKAEYASIPQRKRAVAKASYMQLIHSQRGMLPKLYMRLTYS